MAISAHSRKILWARSGNQCARCQAALVTPDEAAEGDRAIVGEECHIVSRAAGGPRGLEGRREDLDGYDNLILLCANCHCIVDSRPDSFSRQWLLQMKREHEQRLDRSRLPAPLKMSYGDRLADLKFQLVSSGDMLANAVAASSSYTHSRPPDLSSSQLAILGDLLQETADWGDIHDCVGPKAQFEEAERLQEYLDELRAEELVVYFAHRRMNASGGFGPPTHWLHIAIYVLHERDAPMVCPEPIAA